MKTAENKLQAQDKSRTGADGMTREYDAAFVVSDDYQKSLPDMQNASGEAIQGARVGIQQVGISNFRLPLKYTVPYREEPLTLETRVTGTVSLEATRKGINMSRIIRGFSDYQEHIFSPELLEEILAYYKRSMDTFSAQIKLNFSYPMLQRSLRSALSGYQYYDVAFEGIVDRDNRFRKILYFDFVYSSACPCSAELAEHARDVRNVYAIPHSQRSKARLRVEVEPDARVSIEDLHGHCLAALVTETQVMVKREDEQAFAEMNGAAVKFVEDAARLMHEQLDGDRRIRDFEVACAHLESLHSHDAISVIAKGVPGGFKADFSDFKDLIC